MCEEYSMKKYWTNHCKHPKDNYVCSYESIQSTQDGLIEDKIDMYAHSDISLGETLICLRYGQEPHEYMSCGNVLSVASGREEVKKKAIRLLGYLGIYTWTRSS